LRVHAVAEAEAPAGRVDPDAALIAAAVGGDAPAFAALYDRYVDRVYRHVYYRLGDRGDAEDLTQQVFLNAWRAIGRYRCTGAPFVAWLFTIAHNAVAGFYRRAKATRDLELDLEPVATARWTDPEAEALAAYDRAVVRRAILRLKPEQQQVVIMRFVEGLPYAEIAAALSKGEGHVRVLQHRALHELRRLLARQVVV
jgi:RNA polymerase sigma-70 factor (ECF subfamily)